MGLWDILVPAEPGVLHNTIANPSFEYDTGEITKIFGKYSPSAQNVTYWNAVGGATISASKDWASQGQTSLKIGKGISSGAGVEYHPRGNTFAAPTLTAGQAAGGSIGAGKQITFAVMGLTDVGLSLANGITDAQVQPVSSLALPLHSWLYPSIDSRRGHGTLTYSSTVTIVGGSKVATLSILDNSTSRNNYPRGWAIWYSTNATAPTTGTYMLAGVFPNITSYMDGTITFKQTSTAVTGEGTNFVNADVSASRVLYTTNGTTIGTVTAVGSPTSITLGSPPSFSGSNVEFRTQTTISLANVIDGAIPTLQFADTISINPLDGTKVNRATTNFAGTDVGKHIYIKSTNNQYLFVGTIQSVSSKEAILLGKAQFAPIQSAFYISSETNPQSFPENNQGAIRMFTRSGSTYSPKEINLDCSAPYWGVTNSSFGGFTHKHHLYLDWYLSADNSLNPNTTYNNTGADWSVYLYNNYTSTETLLGKLDSTGTTAAAKRMGLRTKFLIDRPANHTEDMRLRIKYTGASASDAVLYIDGVQFVDVGMVWRAYDWYSSNIGTYTTPPQFEDWDWDDVEFSYIDGDTPGGMWSDSMPTQSGTYNASFPYFANDGVWMRDQYEYETPSATTSAGGYAGPRFRLNYQWRNSASPVYGISVPGLSQSSMQTQTFTTGFWAPLSTDNINVIVEPSISGVGMPDIATTSIEYGIVDGGYVQRQVARMRNLQFTITISAQSWVGLHANRRSLINLLKFDQLAQQGERLIRYRGADIPVFTSVTYQSGLEYSGTQGVSFTEALALRFLSTDPYFYTQTSLSTDVSPHDYNKLDFSHVMYKMGNDAAWTPLSHKYYKINDLDVVSTNNEVAGASYFYDDNDVYTSPEALGWIQSPSGSISALVVGGDFKKPVPYLSVFYVSGYNGNLTDSYTSVVTKTNADLSAGDLVTTATVNAWSIVGANQLLASDVGKYIFSSSNEFIGQIASISSSVGPTTGTFTAPAAVSNTKDWSLVSVSSAPIQTLSNNVHLHNLLSANDKIYDVYQESANSVLIGGKVETISDNVSSQPNVSGTGYISSKITNPSATYKNRVFRIFMNDNGKITVQAVDDVFTKSSNGTQVTYTSSLYSKMYYKSLGYLQNASVKSISKTPSNYVIIGSWGDNTSSQLVYDEVLGTTMPGAIDRSDFAFSNEFVTSAVLGIDPVGNALFVGSRQTVIGQGLITTFTTDPDQFYIRGTETSFTNAYVGRSLFTINGLFIGKVYYVESTTKLYVSEPVSIYLYNQSFEISIDIAKVVSDKKSLRSSLYAAAADDSKDYGSGAWNQYMYGYFNNPTLIGQISIVEGSRSFASTVNLLNNFGTSVKALSKIQASNASTSATVTGMVLDDQTLVGNYILAKDTKQFIGQIKEITGETATSGIYGLVFSRKPNMNVTTIDTEFEIRSSRQIVDASGYTSLAGNITRHTTLNVATSEYNARATYSNATIPDFIVPSFNASGTVSTYKTPYIFGDTSNINMFIQTSSDPVNKILRRGVFATYPHNYFYASTLQEYRTQGFGIIVGGHSTPKLAQKTGTLTTTPTKSFTSSLFVASDVGRSVYVTVMGTLTFVGIIRTIASPGPGGTFINVPNPGIVPVATYSNPYFTDKYFPYQFNFNSFNNAYFSKVNQGMTVTNTVAATFPTSFKVNFCNASITSTVSRPLLFAYINSMWQYAGEITNTTASTITVGGGLKIRIDALSQIAIVPAVTIWSSNARAYMVGQELFALTNNSNYITSYIGTIANVILSTDNYAILAVMPYSYSQNTTPGQNGYSLASSNSMVWVNAKQYRGSQVSNFFADAIGTVDSQSGDFTRITLQTFSSTVLDPLHQLVRPGVLRGSISTTNSSTGVTGLNTAFITAASYNNPISVGRYLFTVDGRPISSTAGSYISSVTTTGASAGLSLTLNAAATTTNVHTYYRIGTTRTSFDGGAISSNTGANIVSFDSTSYVSVTINSISTTNVTDDTITLSSSGYIVDNWIGRAIYDTEIGNLIGVVKSLTLTQIVFETTVAFIPAIPPNYTTTLVVASVPLKWTFRPGDIIRASIADDTVGMAGAIVGQVLQINIEQNNVVLTTNASIATSNTPFFVQKGVGIGKGQGVFTSIGGLQITGSSTFFTHLPLNSAIGATADIYVNIGGTSGSYTLVGRATSASSDTVLNIQFSQFTASNVSYDWYYVIRNNGELFNSVDDKLSTINYYTNTIDTYLTASTLGIGTIIGLYRKIAMSSPAYTITPGTGAITSVLNVSPWTVTGSVTTFVSGDVGKSLWVQINNVYVYVGVVASRTNNTSITLSANVYGVVISGSYPYFLADESTVPSFAMLRGANYITTPGFTVPTQFTYQVCPGDIIMTYNGSTAMGYYRVVQVLSDYELIIVTNNGSALPIYSVSYSAFSYTYVVIKQTTETVVFDSGITGYTNPDWQPLGYTNGNITSLNVTPNGDVYVGGAFDEWVKKSSTVVSGDGNNSNSYVKRIAKLIIGLNNQGFVNDAYGAPIAGSSYVRNGFYNGAVYDIIDTSNINPVNGYIGSSDTLMVGGSFTSTADDVTVPSGLAILPSSSISNTMRQITNADLSTVNSGLVESVTVKRMASSNRLRNYNGLVATNTLDGINGSNMAILYNGTVTVNHTTQYHALRVRGNASTYPVITIAYATESNLSNNATKSLYSLIQTATGAKIEFANNNLLVYNGEIIKIDLRLGKRSIVSNLRGNLANALNPNSNFVDFILLGANNSAGLSTQSYDDYRINVVGVHADAGLSVTFTYVPKFWSFDANNLFFGSTKAGL